MLVDYDGTVSSSYAFGDLSSAAGEYELVDNMAIDRSQATNYLYGTTSCTGPNGRCTFGADEHFAVSLWIVDIQSGVDLLSEGSFIQLRIDSAQVLTNKCIVGIRPNLSTSPTTIDIILRGVLSG